MNFDFSEDQEMLKAAVERFIRDNFSPQQRRDYLRDVVLSSSRSRWRALADLGLQGLPFRPEDGGLGGSAIDISVVMEAFGAALVPLPYLSGILLAGQLIDAIAADGQRRHLLDYIIQGCRLIAFAHAEREGRFDIAHIATTARRDDRGFRLSGAKTIVLDGADADQFLIIARSFGNVAAHDGLSAFIVDRDAVGLAIAPYQLADGGRACELQLDDVRIDPAALLGEEGTAFTAVETVITRAAVGLCSEMVGAAATLMEMTLEHLRTRRQFGVTLGSFQAIQHRMAECYLDLELARSMTLKAIIADPDEDRESWLQSACAAKACVSQAALHIAEEAVQFHGAIGLTEELAVGDYLKRIQVIAMLFGNPRSQIEKYNGYIAARLCDAA